MDIRTTSSTQEQPKTIATLSRKDAPLGFMQERSSSSESSATRFRRVRRRSCGKRMRNTHVKKALKDANNNACCTNGWSDRQEDEKAEVEKKIMALQQIVPGGEELGVDKLFEKTAGYILALQSQVKALGVLTHIVEGSGKEMRKLGG